MSYGTARGPNVWLCGQFTSQPHVRCGILGTSSSRTFTARAPHVRLCGEFTAQPHVRCGILDHESVLPHEMYTTLETGEIPSLILTWKPVGFLNHINRRTNDNRFHISLWEFFFYAWCTNPDFNWTFSAM
jgi:hypothetical protein